MILDAVAAYPKGGKRIVTRLVPERKLTAFKLGGARYLCCSDLDD